MVYGFHGIGCIFFEELPEEFCIQIGSRADDKENLRPANADEGARRVHG